MTLPSKPWWSVHTHSRFSVNDAIPSVGEVVDRSVDLGYPALGLTDHGSPSGNIQLYKACRKARIEPLPGMEIYVVPDYANVRSTSMHMGILAYTSAGYENLVTVATIAAKRYHFKPVIDFGDFAAMAESGATEGLLVTTGCWFGLLPTLLRRHEDDRFARQVLESLAGWFPRVYVELQAHGIDQLAMRDSSPLSEPEMVAALIDLAAQTGLPYLIGQDSHYTVPEDRPVHDALKELVSWSDNPDDAKFPGTEGYHMVDGAMLAASGLWDPAVLDVACDNLDELAHKAAVRIPALETFTLQVPDVTAGGDPQAVLEEEVWAAADNTWITLPRHDPAPVSEIVVYRERMEAELATIASSGFAGYILLAAKVVRDYIEAKGIWFHARGSAGGSVVTWLLGITQPDPIYWGLLMERFLSTDRTRPPDIDLDVERDRRGEVGVALERDYAVRRVGNITKYSLADEGEDPDDGAKGNLKVRYFSKRRKQGSPHVEWRFLPAEEKDMLHELSRRGLMAGYGKHASGYVVAPNEASLASLPLAYIASSKTLITAYSKKDVEALGLVKLDLLGLRTLTAIKTTCELLGWSKADYEGIPLDDKETFTAIADGKTVGVFQLEGKSQTYGLMRNRPKAMSDLVAAQALYRPAAMLSGAQGEYVARKRRSIKVPVMHADINAATKETYGVVVYQEQIMSILKTLGMDAEELTDMLDAVKASNEYVAGARVAIANAMPRIRDLAEARGWQEMDLDWLINGLEAYADYGFNKAHAVAYALVAYRTAYFAVHHPVQFWTGMLIAYDDSNKELRYLQGARDAGVSILPAHVNRSGITYTPEPETNSIRKGLLTIAGIGRAAATELALKAPFSSLIDLGRRCVAAKVSGAMHLAIGKTPLQAGGKIAALYAMDALEGLPDKDPHD